MVSFGMTPSVVTFLVKALPTKSVSAFWFSKIADLLSKTYI